MVLKFVIEALQTVIKSYILKFLKVGNTGEWIQSLYIFLNDVHISIIIFPFYANAFKKDWYL